MKITNEKLEFLKIDHEDFCIENGEWHEGNERDADGKVNFNILMVIDGTFQSLGELYVVSMQEACDLLEENIKTQGRPLGNQKDSFEESFEDYVREYENGNENYIHDDPIHYQFMRAELDECKRKWPHIFK